MTQYILQTINGHLIKSYRIYDYVNEGKGEKKILRTQEEKNAEIATRQKQADDLDRKQVVITNKDLFEKIISTYDKHTTNASFDIDLDGVVDVNKIICDKDIKIY